MPLRSHGAALQANSNQDQGYRASVENTEPTYSQKNNTGLRRFLGKSIPKRLPLHLLPTPILAALLGYTKREDVNSSLGMGLNIGSVPSAQLRACVD